MDKHRLSDDGELYRATSLEKGPRSTMTERSLSWRKRTSSTTLQREEYPEYETAWYDSVIDRVDDAYDNWLALVKAPKFKRLAASIICTFAFVVLVWTQVIWPWIEEEKAAYDTFDAFQDDSVHSLFGTNSRPHLDGLIQTKELDPSLLPGGPKAAKARRLIFIGDIHGCKKELLELLVKVKYDKHKDHIVAVGDIVTKGPDSLGVVEFLMDQNATSVRGNHDDRVILLAEKQRGLLHHEDTDDVGETKHKAKHGKKSHEAIARSLTEDQLKYLQSFPLILKVGPLKKIGWMLVVHAGLVPGVSLEAQDPVSVMNMRSIDLKTHVPSKRHHNKAGKRSRPWFKIWGKYQRLLPHLDRIKNPKKWKDGLGSTQLTVVYGHDAKMGKQVSRFSKGLDSNCARGGHLTALVVDEHGKEKIVQVSCHKDYTLEEDE